MFAEVILHRRIPAKFDSFTYEVPQDFALSEGQIVTVPFRKQRLSAIVRKLHNQKPHYKTKLIETAASLVLPPKQMEFAKWMSERYKSSFSKAIDLFVPEKIWNYELRINTNIRIANDTNNAVQTKIPDPKLQKIIKELTRSSGLKLLLEKTPLPREDFYNELIASAPKDSQTLFIFPEIFYAQKFGKGAEQFHSGLNEAKKAEVWENARKGFTKAIFGTRASLFLPFKNLSLIVVDYEHSESYNEKRQPNYNAVEVAQRLAQIWNIPLIIISSTPRVETWYRCRMSDVGCQTWKEREKPAPITILDMADERRKGNFSIFAEKTTQNIAAALAQNKQILLFINRKGEACATLCADCGEIFKCGKCSGILTLHKNNQLKCHRCKIQKQMPEKCEKCGGVKLKSIGSGTEKIEKEIQKIFGKAKILRLDKETAGAKKSAVKISDAKTLNKADILIATQIIDKPLDLPRLKLSIALTPDFLLNMPDFRAGERVFQLLTHIRHLTCNGEMIIQTFLPEHPLFKNLKENRIEDFYGDELKTREMLSLPPFNSI
ncbi:primosomal protein N' [Candidatus Peregrinibacteria bacterium]|nr:primosomal protein N' [Candidatus Peregrinibacteria bacterium]